MLPEWMPNVHPMIVHFPIALLITAFVVDVIALFFRRATFLVKTSTILYVLGALGTLASVISGEFAIETVEVTGQANTILHDHEETGEFAMKFFLVYAALRVVLWWWLKFRMIVWIPLAVIGGIGLFPLFQASTLGGQLVYQQGVGIAMVDSMSARLKEMESEFVTMGGSPEFSGIDEDGGWQWWAGENAVSAFNAAFQTVKGNVSPDTVRDSDGNVHLALTVQDSPALITSGIPVSDVEFLMEVDVSEFNGSVRLIHHMQDSLNYHYMEISDETLRIGALSSGEEEIYDEGLFQPLDGANEFKIVSSTTHFQGYMNGEMLVHGHGAVPQAGITGFKFSGSGTVFYQQIKLSILAE
ncbi:MAG: hypothetical protein OXF06_02945 [Bacteroidetes bacterium]|nr:hypothetical protein [Bacteroidota bacterium]